MCLPGEAMVGDEIQDGMKTAPGPSGRRSSDEAGGVLVERSAAEQAHAPTGPGPANNNNPAQGKHFRRRLLMGALAAFVLGIAAVIGIPWIKKPSTPSRRTTHM